MQLTCLYNIYINIISIYDISFFHWINLLYEYSLLITQMLQFYLHINSVFPQNQNCLIDIYNIFQ